MSSTHLGPKTRFLLLSEICVFVDVGHPLWREDGSVVYNYCWPSPMQSFSSPSSAGLMTIFYFLRFETPPTWRVRSLYLNPPETGWPSYTPRHCFPFSLSPTSHRATVEVFEPASQLKSKSMFVTTDGQSASLCRCQAHLGHRKHHFSTVHLLLRVYLLLQSYELVAVETSLQTLSLVTAVSSDSATSAFNRHVTVLRKLNCCDLLPENELQTQRCQSLCKLPLLYQQTSETTPRLTFQNQVQV
jgi:hypothetical protein